MPDASRKTDAHTCPVHGGGPVLQPCSSNVVTGKLPQARFSDQAICAPPPDVIIQGSLTVLTNMLPSVRVQDKTAHAGQVVMGLPSVKIGGMTAMGKQMKTPGGALTNTFLAFDPVNNRLFISSFLEYTGPGATPAYAAAAKAQIEAMWGGQRTINGKPAEVVVNVNTNVNPTGAPSQGYDAIKVDPAVPRSNQTLGGGPGNQTPSDANPNSYVAAHEYGHTLGLDDQYKDTPKGSVPDPAKTKNTTDNIMCQTWPNTTTGAAPHPYEEHYNTIIKNVGLP